MNQSPDWVKFGSDGDFSFAPPPVYAVRQVAGATSD